MQKLKRRHFLQSMAGIFFASPLHAHSSTFPAFSLPSQGSIAFCYSSPKQDGGWTSWHERARQRVAAHFPEVKFITLENIPYTISATHLLQYLVTENIQMIFTTSNYGPFLQTAARQMPQVAFIECNGNSHLHNLGWFYPAYWHVFYIMGYTAALISKTAKIGFINAFPVPGAIANINATLLGAQKANPAVQIQIITTGSWYSPKMTAEAANTLCDNQCDVLFNLTNDSSHLHIAEQRHCKAVLYNCPDPDIKSPAYISSVYCNIDPFYLQQIQACLKGTWHPNSTLLTFPEYCDYLPLGTTVSSAIQQQVMNFRNRFILNGKSFYGPIHDQDGVLQIPFGQRMQDPEIYQWDWFVKNIKLI